MKLKLCSMALVAFWACQATGQGVSGSTVSQIGLPYATPTKPVNGQCPVYSSTYKAFIPNTCTGGGSGVTWARDLAGSTDSSQTVVGINGTLLSGLSTGLLKITTGTGAASIAVAGTDFAGLANNNPFTSAQTLTLAPAANTIADGWVLQDTTAASASNQQYSPAIHLIGQGWKTNATAASQTADVQIVGVPIQGAASPQASLLVQHQVAGGGYTNLMSLGGSTYTIGNATENPAYSFPGSGSFTTPTGTTFTAALQAGGPVIQAGSTTSQYRWGTASAGTDQKNWSLNAASAGPSLVLQTLTDAAGTGHNIVNISRGTTVAITDVSFGNATDNNTTHFLGTGQVSIAGNLSAPLLGTVTNDNAVAGNIGEYWEAYCSVVTSGASIAFTNASPTVGTYASPPWALINGSQAAFGSFACPFVITANAPTGLSTATNYWAVPINSTTFHVSTSAANAMAGTFANTTGTSSTANLTTSVSVTTATVISTAAMKLTAGDWDCTSLAIFVPTATTSVTALASGVGSSPTVLPAIATTYVTAADVLNVTTTSPFNQPSSPYRISLASGTAEYATVEGVFTASTLTAANDFRCRRVR